MTKQCYIAHCKSDDVYLTTTEMVCRKCGSRRKLNPAEKEMIKLGMTEEEYYQLLLRRQKQILNLKVGEEVQLEGTNKFVSRKVQSMAWQQAICCKCSSEEFIIRLEEGGHNLEDAIVICCNCGTKWHNGARENEAMKGQTA